MFTTTENTEREANLVRACVYLMQTFKEITLLITEKPHSKWGSAEIMQESLVCVEETHSRDMNMRAISINTGT